MPREATATPERILKAAFARFSRYGFRRTSMEDIASEAGVSRAALYLQFKNKEEIFRTLACGLQESALARATAEAKSDRPFAERLCAAIEAKTIEFVEIAYGSPHGAELMDETNRSCGDVVADARERFLDLLVRFFRRAADDGEIDLSRAGLKPASAAALIHGSIQGLKGVGVSVDQYRANVAALVRVFAAGLAPAKPGESVKRTGAASVRRRAARS
jgi:AcrR family transcriptional regulator